MSKQFHRFTEGLLTKLKRACWTSQSKSMYINIEWSILWQYHIQASIIESPEPNNLNEYSHISPLYVEICAHSPTRTFLGSGNNVECTEEAMSRPGRQSVFQFKTKLFSRCEVRALCRPLEILLTNNVSVNLTLCTRVLVCWNRFRLGPLVPVN